MSVGSAPVSRRQYKLTGSLRQFKVELPWVADYIIVTNPNTQRLYVHSGSGEFPDRSNYDLMFPGQAKSQDGVESSYFGLTLGEPTDTANSITETTVVVFVRGGSVSAFGSMPIAPLATVSLAPGTSVGITGTPDVNVPGGVGIVGTPNVAVPGGVGITNTPSVAIPGGTAIVGTPNVAIPGGAVVSGTVTNNPAQLSGTLLPYTANFALTGPTQLNHGWYDLAGWGGAIFHLESNTASVDLIVQWYVSPNAGVSSAIVKSWTVRAGQTLVIRVPKIDRYVLFSVVVLSGSIAWNAAVRAIQETVFEPSVQMSGSVQEWKTNGINFAAAGTGLQYTGLTLPAGYEIMGLQVGHNQAIGVNPWILIQMGTTGLAVAHTLYRGYLNGGNTSGYINLSTPSGGVLIQSGVSDAVLIDAAIALTMLGGIMMRRRVFT